SHNGLTGSGTDGGDWAYHQIEHELGGMFDVAHGAGLAAVWGSWARYVYRDSIDRFVRFAENVMQIPHGEEKEQTALKGIAAMEEFYRSVDMPTSIKALGVEVTDAQIEELAEKCTFFGRRTVGCVKALGKEDIMRIYEAAR
ncbi:MAG: iron-containing alcohol dehydrogenase, partial [Lachnospiraceae bacterium]|nr:iron-containing alcohol dehydrogenase [Lachnospiraceae bacterium]